MGENNPIQQRRFVSLDVVKEVLSISKAQAYALVHAGDIRAIRVGGRGQWRIEEKELARYIERSYHYPNDVR